MRSKVYKSFIGCIAVIGILTAVNNLGVVKYDTKESPKLRVNYDKKQVHGNINREKEDNMRVNSTEVNQSIIEILPNPDPNEIITLRLL